MIEELTEKAFQEKKIENELKKVNQIWSTINFERQNLTFRDFQIDILKIKDEDLETLDEH